MWAKKRLVPKPKKCSNSKNQLTFFEVKVDGRVALAGGVPRHGLVGAGVGGLHVGDLQVAEVEQLAVGLPDRHLVPGAGLDPCVVVIPAKGLRLISRSSTTAFLQCSPDDLRQGVTDELALEEDLGLLLRLPDDRPLGEGRPHSPFGNGCLVA